jgi:hypothetical protein
MFLALVPIGWFVLPWCINQPIIQHNFQFIRKLHLDKWNDKIVRYIRPVWSINTDAHNKVGNVYMLPLLKDRHLLWFEWSHGVIASPILDRDSWFFRQETSEEHYTQNSFGIGFRSHLALNWVAGLYSYYDSNQNTCVTKQDYGIVNVGMEHFMKIIVSF